MEVTLKNQVAWITGGGEGIGRAIATLASRCGAKVALTGLKQDLLEEAAAEIREAGGEALAVPGDVSKPEEMEQAVAAIIKEWGRLTFVCANAGINGTWAPVDELTPQEWSKTIAVNLTGTYLTLHYAVPHMKAGGGGSVVIMSSVNGTRIFSNEGASAYASSKAGQLALGQMLALELAPSRIRVNVICPGAIDTGIQQKTKKRNLEEIETPVEFPKGNIPLTGGDMGRAEQVADLAVFLASDAASHITGTPVWIDGAESLLQG
jgi:NAD(P)-dependent dehydrogenase (short-subunit alcohol dehydrogenase family)